MMTNGTGPRPMAKELSGSLVGARNKSGCLGTYQTNVMMKTLASVVRFVSRPIPTQMSEMIAPPVDRLSNHLRPRR